MAENLYWKVEKTPEHVARALHALAEEYPLRQGAGVPCLAFEPGGDDVGLKVTRTDEGYSIRYRALADALRGVGAALAGLPAPGSELADQSPFSMLGVMLDCSRNAVMRPDHVKRWMRRLSLFGYNMVMLYTEDTYTLPGETFFGFLRGAYTPEELKEMDACAAELGIDMIGCIQTLGHMGQVLKWSCYRNLKDTDRILLAGEPATYTLIEKMVENFAGCFRSRRIHVGMDEAKGMGQGEYLRRHGMRDRFATFNEHLADVVRICRENGLSPMIWSDMYFRIAGNGKYYNPGCDIPARVRAAVPEDVQLVYWDYYKPDKQSYAEMIEAHRSKLGAEPVMASAVWTLLSSWYGRGRTEHSVPLCVEACREARLKEFFFTLWGGMECELDSALAGLAYGAHVTYGKGDDPELRARYEAACGVGYEEALIPSRLDDPRPVGGVDSVVYRDVPGGIRHGSALTVLWDDPLLGTVWQLMEARHPGYWRAALAYYDAVVRDLVPHRGQTEPLDMDHALTMTGVVTEKIRLRLAMEKAYASRDGQELERVAGHARRVAGLTDVLAGTFRRQWYRRNKPFGLEAVQVRLGGLRQRLLEVAARFDELAGKKISSIPELDEARAACRADMAKVSVSSFSASYARLATSGTGL